MGSNFGNVFFHPQTTDFPAQVMPLWLEVKERKIAGGTVDLSSFSVGDIIPAAIPVHLGVMGGEATLLPTFEVAEAVVAASSTSLVLKPLAGIAPAKNMIVGKMSSSGVVAKAVTLGDPTYDETEGTYTFTITAGDVGALAVGDILVIAKEAGSNKAALLPTGLSWRQIVITNKGAYKGTVAVVTKGQLLGDRAPQIPDYYKAAMPGITYENELSE